MAPRSLTGSVGYDSYVVLESSKYLETSLRYVLDQHYSLNNMSRVLLRSTELDDRGLDTQTRISMRA